MSRQVMIASTVSSKMLSAVAAQEGFTFEETLPGFKWMGHRGQELKAQGKTILFAFEEAIGFGPGDVLFEKVGGGGGEGGGGGVVLLVVCAGGGGSGRGCDYDEDDEHKALPLRLG